MVKLSPYITKNAIKYTIKIHDSVMTTLYAKKKIVHAQFVRFI